MNPACTTRASWSSLPVGWSRGSAWTLPYPAVRAAFGRPTRSYRFDGYEVLVWNVNLLTRMGE
jgi:hypothetical protein